MTTQIAPALSHDMTLSWLDLDPIVGVAGAAGGQDEHVAMLRQLLRIIGDYPLCGIGGAAGHGDQQWKNDLP